MDSQRDEDFVSPTSALDGRIGEARSTRPLRRVPDRLETGSVKLIGLTPLMSFAIVLASVAAFRGVTTWVVIGFAIGFGNLASLLLALSDKQLLLQRWTIVGPAVMWTLVSPAIYLAQRATATRAHELASLRPLWRWIASVAIVMFSMLVLQLWSGAISQLSPYYLTP
jgi:hypothetical protein